MVFDRIHWKDHKDIRHLRREMDNLFDRFSEGWPFKDIRKEGDWNPPADILETAADVIVLVEAAGLSPDSMEVSLQGDQLLVRGKRSKPRKDEELTYHRVERPYGSFGRTIRLPALVDESGIRATYKDGVLEITLPKIQEESSRKINIEVD